MDIRILIDADACPVKDETYRVAERYGLKVVLVSGTVVGAPLVPWIERVVVGSGLDAADDWIAERCGPTDIVVTADIPLAARAIKAGARVVAPEGRVHTESSIGATLATRNLMTHLRETGMQTGGRGAFSKQDRSRYLSALDTVVQALRRGR